MALENELSHKQKLLKKLERENTDILAMQKEQEKAIQLLKKNSNYEKKFSELNVELKGAKEHVRKLQQKEREDAKLMQTQHEQLVLLEDRARKLTNMIKDKKKIAGIRTLAEPILSNKKVHNYSMEDIENLQEQLREVEE